MLKRLRGGEKEVGDEEVLFVVEVVVWVILVVWVWRFWMKGWEERLDRSVERLKGKGFFWV